MQFKVTAIASYPVPVRLGIFAILLLLLWSPFAIPLYIFFGDRPNLVSISTMAILYIEFIGLLRFWSKKVYQNPRWLHYYGIEATRYNGIACLRGLSLGLILTLSLFAFELSLGFLEFISPSVTLIKIIAEGLIIAVLVSFSEELLFRGWILNELDQNYSTKIALLINALLFAALHYIKPLSEMIRTLPQFPALFILGAILVQARRLERGKLGKSIGIHAGLIWGYYIVKVGGLIENLDYIPSWITGIDGNPLAGLIGLAFLGILAYTNLLAAGFINK